jgi:transcriptional regulator with XRE-family HTH domain
VSIGGALTEARKQAGLTITQVSQRTRIRETIIRDIERDDYSACGGDFYARGHIRAIAHVIGTDPVPLIAEYDAARCPQDQAHGTPNGQAKGHYHGREADGAPSDGAAGARPGLTGITAAEAFRPAMPLRPPPRRVNWTAGLVVVLAAALALLIYLLVSGPSHGSGKAAAGGHHRTGPTASARPTARASSSPASHAAVSLSPASAAAFGPGGAGQGDNPQLAGLAIDGNPATAWHSDWYATPNFGGLQSGTGVLLDMGKPVMVSRATVVLGSSPGATVQLRLGNSPVLADLPAVAQLTNAGGTVVLRAASPVSARYLLIWFTRLPPDNAGTYQAFIYEIKVAGTS